MCIPSYDSGMSSEANKINLAQAGPDLIRRMGPYGNPLNPGAVDSPANAAYVQDYLARLGDNPADLRAQWMLNDLFSPVPGTVTGNTRRAIESPYQARGQYHPPGRANPDVFYTNGRMRPDAPMDAPLGDPNYAPGYNDPRHPKFYRG